MIQVIKGDLIKLAKEGKFDVIAHGCNCFCIMGAGIAVQIKKEFPEAYKEDLATLKGDVYKLGEFSKYRYKNLRLTVFNLYTQYLPGSNFEYAAFCLAIRNMKEVIKEDSIIGLPLIGCGIGGGSRQIVMEIIKKELGDFQVYLVEYEK
jgi:O-acetyl-ADP-ribose deacetylase (regulator of RNase III)